MSKKIVKFDNEIELTQQMDYEQNQGQINEKSMSCQKNSNIKTMIHFSSVFILGIDGLSQPAAQSCLQKVSDLGLKIVDKFEDFDILIAEEYSFDSSIIYAINNVSLIRRSQLFKLNGFLKVI